MPITLHSTGYGAQATRLLVERVAAAKDGAPLRPVTIVVPSNFVGVSIRRELAKAFDGGIIGLGILTIYRVAELLGAAPLAAAGRRPVSTPVIGAAIRQVLAEEPGLFAGVADHPATEASLVRAFRELSACTEGALDRLAAGSGRSAEVVRVHRAARARLLGEWYDEADLMVSATKAVATSTVVDDLGTVLLHLPQRLAPASAGLVLALSERTAVEGVIGLTGRPKADVEVVQTVARLGATLPVAERQPMAVTRVVTVSDADEEARSAVAAVIDAARGSVPLSRMAILYPSPEPYARIVAEHLDAAGIDWNGRAVRPLADRLAGRWLIDLLDLAESRWARPDVIGLFAAAPLRATAGHTVRVAAWERISRDAGIVDGKGEWVERLAAYGDARLAEAAAEDARNDEERRDWLAERFRRQAQTADDLREVVEALQADLDTALEMRTWDELATWASWMLGNHLGNEQQRRAWPAVEQAAAQKVEAALDRLRALDAIEPSTTLHTFTRALELELEDDLGRVGRFGEGVLVGTLAAGLGVDLDVVVVLGLAEGVLPTRPREDSLLSDADRRLVEAELPPRASRVGEQHRQLVASLAAATDQRVLVFPRGDLRRSVERASSRWLLDAVEEVTGNRRLDAAADLVEHVPSFAGRMARTAFPADERAFRLLATDRALGGARLDSSAAGELDDALVAGTRLLEGRGRDAFTRFNGDLSLVAELVGDRHGSDALMSASRIESYVHCPHGYLVRHLLRVEPVENPEEQLNISPLVRGSLVHDVLERWIGEQLDEGAVPPPSQTWPTPARERLLEIAHAELDRVAELGVVGHPVLWRRDRAEIERDLVDFLSQDDALRRRDGLTPIAVEAAFGLNGAAPLDVDLGDGRTMRFRGMIDRLDRRDDGALVVTDYKTGSTRAYTGMSQDDPDVGGSRLQLMIYALAARQLFDEPDALVHAQYWFTSGKGGWKTIGYTVDEAVEGRLRQVLRTMVRQIEAGVFPQRPDAPGWSMWVNCHYCDPDALGTAHRHREWERLVQSPALADYLAIVEPGLGATP